MTLGLLPAAGSQDEQKAPDKLVFEAKIGNVTFDHVKHVERAEQKCKACHDKLFPQSKAPLNYKDGMHKPAEAEKTSCAGCHNTGGMSFPAKGNCKKCHVKKPVQPETPPADKLPGEGQAPEPGADHSGPVHP